MTEKISKLIITRIIEDGKGVKFNLESKDMNPDEIVGVLYRLINNMVAGSLTPFTPNVNLKGDKKNYIG